MTLAVRPFFQAHATHPDWRMAVALCAAHIDGQRAMARVATPPTLGWVYLTEHYLTEADALLADLHARWPGLQWVGGCGAGVLAGGVEYRDEPALVMMVSDLDPEAFRVFSGQRPLNGFAAAAVQVHADLEAPDLPELLRELGARTEAGALFGGVVLGGGVGAQIAEEVLSGGVSGVALRRDVAVLTRIAQGCRAIGPVRRVTAIERNQVLSLDGQPALDCLLHDLGLTADSLRTAAPQLGTTLAGLVAPADGQGSVAGNWSGAQLQVRRLVGVSPGRGGVALAENLEEWSRPLHAALPELHLAFCRRDAQSAWRDLVRICSEIRDELLPDDEAWDRTLAQPQPLTPDQDPTPAWLRSRIAGALYVSCAGRGGEHFGAPSAELQTIRQALGDVPLVGLFAAGEIVGEKLYSHAGVLTVFLCQEVPA
jgi:small ligand-binding sensory domain FIST